MLSRSNWVALLAVCALAACASQNAGTVPSGPRAFASIPIRASATVTHAACTLAPGLKIPLTGTPVVATAFGQLMVDAQGTRYANPSVIFKYAAGRRVYASTGGVAHWYPALAGFGKTIVIHNASGVETLYGDLERATITFSKHGIAGVKAGQQIALSGASNLPFEYARSGSVIAAGTQNNPCGSAANDGASATIDVMPQNVAVYARFHALSVDGVAESPGPYPVSSPDVATPATIASAHVVTPSTLAATVYERSDVWSNYYLVLCGNAAFATGPARYAGPFTYDENNTYVVQAQPSPPPVVFFRDAGDQAAALTAPLPQQAGVPAPAAGCPAAPPANVYVGTSLTYNQVGQTSWVYYWCNIAPDSVTFTSNDPEVAIATPSPLTDYPAPQPNWPPPINHTDFIAKGIGSATIAVADVQCALSNDKPINVVVNATPSPAPAPTPMSNP